VLVVVVELPQEITTTLLVHHLKLLVVQQSLLVRLEDKRGFTVVLAVRLGLVVVEMTQLL
jgi:hypothetical protein